MGSNEIIAALQGRGGALNGGKTVLEVIYRIYKVADKGNSVEDGSVYCGTSENIEVTMDCKICESRDHFKELIREEYGESIAFRNTKKLNVGDLYCIIIGEHCYNSERYFNRIEYTCACCGARVSGYINKAERLENWEIKNDLCNQTEKYGDLLFCSYKCKQHFIEKERRKCMADGLIDESFITKDSFSYSGIAGYIYKISKKSTGEFYIGQTMYAPVFRWGQHLKTERFDIKGILDYQFEVIEIVPKGVNILEREKYFIQKYYKENPEKSLNIMCTSNINTDQLEMDACENGA